MSEETNSILFDGRDPQSIWRNVLISVDIMTKNRMGAPSDTGLVLRLSM